MRLSEDKIKQGILHPDPEVRAMAIRYFSDAFSQDPTVMPLVIQAIEKYDWRTGICGSAFRAGLVQTDETLTWLLQELGREMEEEDEDLVKLPADSPRSVDARRCSAFGRTSARDPRSRWYRRLRPERN